VAATSQQSALRPVQLAVAEGATTPNPGTTNALAWSTTLGGMVRWTGTAWTTYPTIPANPPGAANFLEVFGHSFFNQPVGTGTSVTSISTDQTGEMVNILASALNIPPSSMRNHAITSSQLVLPGRNQCGFARVLADIQRKRKTYPFVRSGGMYLGCWGINDIGHNGNTATVQARYKDGLRAFISRARSSAIYLAGSGAPWTFGAGFTAAAATFLNQTSGAAIRATTTTSSVATFTIPIGYKGESICFAVLCSAGATGGDITWGGTVTGTSGITGVVTSTDSGGVNSNYGLITRRFTAAANGLSAKNAGQTITLTVTRVSASGEVIVDSAWIEASKPDPVIVCNQPRLPARKYTIAFGDVATTASSTTITSAIAGFSTAWDAGNAITETDAQGAFTAGKTIASVTNATTAVLSAAAAATKTNVEVTLDRTIIGYTQYSVNTNFANATVASHAAADADVVALNSWITSVVAEFDSMVQIADLEAAIGADANLPSNVYTYYALVDGLHPNELGNMKCANAMFDAIELLKASDPMALSNLELPGIPAPTPAAPRRPHRTGHYWTAEFGGTGTATSLGTAGVAWAIPIVVTEAAEKWNQLAINQTNAPTTSGGNLRAGFYDDISWDGYPNTLVWETNGAFAMGTTAAMKTLGSFGWNVRPGLYWLVLKVDSLGTTASTVSFLNGPNPLMPAVMSGGTTGGNYMGYQVTGLTAGSLPQTFPTGGTAVTSAPALLVLTQ
jgi:hypothetical protein